MAAEQPILPDSPEVSLPEQLAEQPLQDKPKVPAKPQKPKPFQRQLVKETPDPPTGKIVTAGGFSDGKAVDKK